MNRFKAIPAYMALFAALAGSTAALACGPDESFAAENDAAMMEAMSVKPTGDVDADFVAMMVPHHQGAIDMAAVYLRYGKDERLRRLAQEIIVTQKDEIAVMQLAVPQPAVQAAGAAAAHHAHDHHNP
jgi:uncharacterized protein (DUF305 family)